MKIEKIGELNFEEFKTEFQVVQKIKKFYEEERISLASLIPDAWLWYEVQLFETLDENKDGIPDEKFGKEFIVIYYGIINLKDSKNKTFTKKLFDENLDELTNNKISLGEKPFSNSEKNKTFNIKYIIMKK